MRIISMIAVMMCAFFAIPPVCLGLSSDGSSGVTAQAAAQGGAVASAGNEELIPEESTPDTVDSSSEESPAPSDGEELIPEESTPDTWDRSYQNTEQPGEIISQDMSSGD